MTKETKKEEVVASLNVYQKFHKLMQDISYVQKGDKTVNGLYRFVSHDAVVKAVRPHILENGLVVNSRITEKTLELQEITETVLVYDKQAGTKVPMFVDGVAQVKTSLAYVCTIFMEFDFVNIDNPAEKITAQGYGMGIDPQDKATGKAQSYAKKYAFLNALLLETGDDPEQDVNYEVIKKTDVKPEVLFKDLLENVVQKAVTLEALGANWKVRGSDIVKLEKLSPELFTRLVGYKDDRKGQFTNTQPQAE